MAIDLNWLLGKRLKNVEKTDYWWKFTFDDECHVSTNTFWRLLGERVLTTSEDHGHQFGLPAPVDAGVMAKNHIAENILQSYEIGERTGDLSLTFANGLTLQFMTTSSGYEGWEVCYRNQQTICLGGGEIAVFGQKDNQTAKSQPSTINFVAP